MEVNVYRAFYNFAVVTINAVHHHFENTEKIYESRTFMMMMKI